MLKKLVIFLFYFLIINLHLSYAYIDVINLGIINYKNEIKGRDKIQTETLNYNKVKNKIISVLKSHKIKYKLRTGLIDTQWYIYENKQSKLYITLMADESQIRMQLQQKAIETPKLSKMNPDMIKKDIEQILKN